MVNYAKTYFTAAFPEIWLFMLGGLFVITTLFLPEGVVGLFRQIKNKWFNKVTGDKKNEKADVSVSAMGS